MANEATPVRTESGYTSLFHALTSNSILILTNAPVYTIAAATAVYSRLVGIATENLVGRGLFDVFRSNPHDAGDTGAVNLEASLNYVLQHREPHRMPVQRYDTLRKDGTFEERYWSSVNSPVLSEEGRITYIVHTTEEITEQVKAGEIRKRLKGIELVHRLFMQVPAVISIITGADHVVALANEAALKLWGKDAHVIGKPLMEVVPEAAEQGIIDRLNIVRKTGQPYFAGEVPVVTHRSGHPETRYFDLAYQPYYEEGISTPSGVFTYSHDVTEQVEARRILKESSQELELAIEIADLGSFRLDLRANRATNSSKVDEWFGYKVQGYSREEGFNPIHPEDRERVDRVILQTLQSTDHSRHDVTYRVVHPVTGAIKHLRSFGQTLYDKEGPYLILGIIQDITVQVLHRQQLEESEGELQKRVLERTLELEHKNRELEQFTYAASHDMQEPLRKIATFSNFLLLRHSEGLDEGAKSYLHKIDGSVQRMKTIIDDLLQYSHQVRDDQQFETVHLEEIIRHIRNDLDLVIEQKGAVLVTEGLIPIVAVPNQMHQLFYNLVTNALKFSHPHIPPQIRIRAQRVPGTIPALKGLQPGKEYVQVEVSDNGIGFKPEYAEQIFSLFKRLHGRSEYEGTGIGLALCKKIAENHGGAIWAESGEGRGATFFVLLPAD